MATSTMMLQRPLPTLGAPHHTKPHLTAKNFNTTTTRSRNLRTYLLLVAKHVNFTVTTDPPAAPTDDATTATVAQPRYLSHTYSCPLLQPRIRAAKSWRALENLHQADPAATDPSTLASLIAHLPRVLPLPYRKAVQKHAAPLHRFTTALLDALPAAIPALTPRDTALVLWSLAKLDLPTPPPTRAALLLHAQAHLNRCSDQDLATLAWAAARLAPAAPLPPTFLPALEAATLSPRHKCNGQDLGMLVWGLGSLHHTPSPLWLSNICAAVHAHLPVLNGQNFSNILWGLACMPATQPPPDWVSSILPAAQAQLHAMTNQNLVNVLWSLGRMGHRQDPEFVAAWLEVAGTRLSLFNSLDIANTVWALAHLKFRPPWEWMQRLLAASAARSAQYRPQQVARLLWGLAELGVRPEPRWVEVHVAAAVGGSAVVEARCVADILGAMVDFGVGAQLPELTEMLVEEALQQATCNAQTLKRIVRALAALRFRPSPAWVNDFLHQAARHAPRLAPDHICTLIWTAATIGTPPHPAALRAFLAATTAHQTLQRCNQHQTYRLALALARLPVALPQEAWGRLRGRVREVGWMMEAAPRRRLQAALRAIRPQQDRHRQGDQGLRQQQQQQHREGRQQPQQLGAQELQQQQQEQQELAPGQQEAPQLTPGQQRWGAQAGYTYYGGHADRAGAPLVHLPALHFACRR